MSTENFIEQLYQTYLGRPSQPEGKAYWVKQIDGRLLNAAEVTTGFMESTEYTGSVAAIVHLYHAAFGRAPEIKGLSFWQNKLKSGVSIQKISAEFIAATEFQQKYDQITTKEAYFNALFETIFERPASAAARDYWINEFDNGLSVSEIVRRFSESAEFKAKHKAEIDITLKYYGILNTEPTQFEMDRALFKNDPLGLVTELYASSKYQGESVPFLIQKGTVIANGPVNGATVFIDLNGDKILNKNELFTTTDKEGNWSFGDKGTFNGTLLTFGGIDVSTSQPVKGQTPLNPDKPIETEALTTSLRYTTGSVPPGTENTITVTEHNTLRIFATFNYAIQHETIPVIHINNGKTDIISGANMTRISDLNYYYDLDVPAGDFTGKVSIKTQSLNTGKIVNVKTSNTNFSVDSAPEISSSTNVLTIDENIGKDQVVYKASSNDLKAVYTLKDTPDRAAFTIDSGTGIVTLNEDPDFEIRPSYSFTVIASDVSGNVNEKIITLRVNDIDEINPTVQTVTSTPTNGSYRDGDVIPVTVEFNEIVAVTGIPTLTLKIGAVERVVPYSSGSGTTQLNFNYTVQAEDAATDIGYISSAALILANESTISDSIENKAILTLPTPTAEGSLAQNTKINIDNVIPKFVSMTPSNNSSDVSVGSDLQLTYNENIAFGKTGRITLVSGNDVKRIDVAEAANQLSIEGKVMTLNPSTDFKKGLSTYTLTVDEGAIVDLAKNPAEGITSQFITAINTNVVIFDMTTGKNSSHSGREFKTDVDYNIYLRVDSKASTLTQFKLEDAWKGGENLGQGDVIHLVGNGGQVKGNLKNGVLSKGKLTQLNTKIEWFTAVQNKDGTAETGKAFVLKKAGIGSRSYDNAKSTMRLWTGGVELQLMGKEYNTNIQQNLLQTQGVL
jgi:hypothetical protein